MKRHIFSKTDDFSENCTHQHIYLLFQFFVAGFDHQDLQSLPQRHDAKTIYNLWSAVGAAVSLCQMSGRIHANDPILVSFRTFSRTRISKINQFLLHF